MLLLHQWFFHDPISLYEHAQAVSFSPHENCLLPFFAILACFILLDLPSWDVRTRFSSFVMAYFSQNGNTCLLLAAKEGHADAVQALLDAGADRYLAEVRMTHHARKWLLMRSSSLWDTSYSSSLTVYKALGG